MPIYMKRGGVKRLCLSRLLHVVGLKGKERGGQMGIAFDGV